MVSFYLTTAAFMMITWVTSLMLVDRDRSTDVHPEYHQLVRLHVHQHQSLFCSISDMRRKPQPSEALPSSHQCSSRSDSPLKVPICFRKKGELVQKTFPLHCNSRGFWSHPFTLARFVAFVQPSTSEKDTFYFTAFSTKVTGFVIVAGFLVSNGLT